MHLKRRLLAKCVTFHHFSEEDGALSSSSTNSYDLSEQHAIKGKRRVEGRQKYALSYYKKNHKKRRNTMADVAICFGLFHFFEVALIT